ncbi:MAG TPA: hypothetical protein VJZ49_14870 [Syntrophales bacterium]|nr:hypothetical protein [Syntrophales bacterium]
MDNLFAEKLTILGKFRSATVALRDALDGEDVDAINVLLTERQQFIDLVNRIDSAIGPLAVRREGEKEFRREFRKLLEDTTTLDRDCAERLQSHVRKLRDAAAKISPSPFPVNRKVLTKQNVVPRFLDIRT